MLIVSAPPQVGVVNLLVIISGRLRHLLTYAFFEFIGNLRLNLNFNIVLDDVFIHSYVGTLISPFQGSSSERLSEKGGNRLIMFCASKELFLYPFVIIEIKFSLKLLLSSIFNTDMAAKIGNLSFMRLLFNWTLYSVSINYHSLFRRYLGKSLSISRSQPYW